MNVTDFSLSYCKLIQSFPLTDYRIQINNGSYLLPILLIGQGTRISTLLNETLTQGQLLETSLEITVATTNTKKHYDTLITTAPYLPHFTKIVINGAEISTPRSEDHLCTLNFIKMSFITEQIQTLLKENTYSYILISTGNDDINQQLAESIAQTRSSKTFIGYVQKKNANVAEIIPSLAVPFGARKQKSYRDNIENIALNLHYCYSKSQNERIPIDQITEEFKDDPYIYTSNIAAALHMRAKLACCDILDDDPLIAAKKFASLMKKDPQIIDRLMVVEHKRWVISKVLDGYSQLENIEWIYRNGATTHSVRDKWHCCLVSSMPSAKSRITEDDWDNTATIIRSDLDDLDTITLQIHERCRVLSDLTSGQVNDILQAIRMAIYEHPEFPLQIFSLLDDLERAILQIRQQKKSAIALYAHLLNRLKEIISQKNGLATGFILDSLNTLHNAMLPLIEFTSCKNYKEQDRYLVEYIPFALTHKIQPTIIKILSKNNAENLFSSWQLEPQKLYLFSMATTNTELLQIREQYSNIKKFAEDSLSQTTLVQIILLPTSFLNRQFIDEGILIVEIPQEASLVNLTQVLQPIIKDCSADYIDITGGNPLLSHAIEHCAVLESIPTFFVENGKMIELNGARELAFKSPEKSLTIKEMFNISGAEFKTSESQRLSDLSLCYEKLWQIENENKNYWASFCETLNETIELNRKESQSKNIFKFQPPSRNSTNPLHSMVRDVGISAMQAIVPQLVKMQELNYINDLSVFRSHDNKTYNISFTDNVAYSPSDNYDTLSTFLQKSCNIFQPSYDFSMTNHNRWLECDDLQVKNMPTIVSTALHKNHLYHILLALSNAGLIKHYQYNKSQNICSFQFASKDIKRCFEKAGSVLEYFIYYSALEADFDDVDMGFEFFHDRSIEAASNEIDIICTKGTTSLFISAKLRSPQFFRDNLKYVLYEISLLTEKFGTTATKAVLVAPSIDQFQEGDFGEVKYSSPVSNALRRNVYLLGRECVKDSVTLGQVFANIIAGKDDWCDFLM